MRFSAGYLAFRPEAIACGLRSNIQLHLDSRPYMGLRRAGSRSFLVLPTLAGSRTSIQADGWTEQHPCRRSGMLFSDTSEQSDDSGLENVI